MSAPRRLRSEYSKNGCKECKRRKIKCDEFINPPPEAIRKINKQGRVACWQCTRLRKECEYPLKGEKVARVSRKAMMEQKRQEAAANGDANPYGQALPGHGMNGLGINQGMNGHMHAPALNGLGQPGMNGLNGSLTGQPVNGGYGLNGYASQNGPSYQGQSPLSGGSTYQNGLYPQNAPSAPNSLNGYLYPHNAPAAPSAPNFNGYGLNFQNGQSNALNGAWDHKPIRLPTPVNRPEATSSATASSTTEPPEHDDQPLDGLAFYDQLDLTLLAADLNNLVLDMIYDVNYEPKTDLELQPTPPTPTSEDNEGNYYDYIPRNLPLGYIEVRKHTEKAFLHEFYREFANIILPFNAYDASARSFFNPARDILLKCAHKEPFLLAAVLAQGARSVFSKLANPDDEQAYYSYLLRCLKLLGPALGDAGKNGLALVSNIEAVLLTVLLLTSSNAVNAKQNWRPHLRGAKDLLLKHNKNRPLTRKLKVLIFCKYWFVSFEILAGLGLKLGGTVHVDEELDLLLNYADPYEVQVLTELGLILPNGFNLIGGYHNDCVPHLRDLIKLLNRGRKKSLDGVSTTDLSPGAVSGAGKIPDISIQSTECIRLLGEFERERNKTFFSTSTVMSPDDFPNGVIPQNYLLDSATVESTRKIVSWLDISQQAYCLAALITILTDFLGVAHDLVPVQELTHKLLDLVSFVESPNGEPVLFKYAPLMVQWPVLVAGLNVVKAEDVKTVEKFFSVASEVGSGSAGHSLKMIHRHWKRREFASDDSEEEHVDVVNY